MNKQELAIEVGCLPEKEENSFTWTVQFIMDEHELTEKQASFIIDSLNSNEFICSEVDSAISDAITKLFGHEAFLVSGYWKDNKEEFENYLFYEYDSCPEGIDDDAIFYYGMSELEIQEDIRTKGADTNLDFVITSYEKTFIK
jgi:hypothetical protein